MPDHAYPSAPQAFDFSHGVTLGQGTAPPVFVVVHSNGAFFPLGHQLGARHPFIALQAASRRLGGELPGTIEAIAACYAARLLAMQPAGPFVIMGWCLAGTVAYEVAQQLRAAGHEVRAVVMVDTWCTASIAAQSRLRRVLADRSYRTQTILTDFGKVLRGKTSLGGFLARRRVTARFRRPAPAATPAAAVFAANRAFDEALLAQLRRAASRYQPQPYQGVVLQIRSSEEPGGFGLPQDFGWSGLAQDYRMATVPGDHLEVFLEPGINLVSEHIRRAAGLA